MASEEWGEVIQFLDEWCYGIAPDGQTICCGSESEVKEILVNQNKKSSNPIVNEILDLERKLIREKEIEHGKSGDITPKSGRSQRVVKTRRVGTRPSAYSQRKSLHFRPTKKR